MTDLKQAAQQALEALETLLSTTEDVGRSIRYDTSKAITALRTALEQQAEPVSHAVIAGALFDFMGWLTTRKERLVLSSTDNASPAADAIKDFAEMRGLLLDDAKVQDWQAYTTPPQQQAEPPSEWPLIKNILDEYGLQAISFVAEWKAAQQHAEPVAWDKPSASFSGLTLTEVRVPFGMTVRFEGSALIVETIHNVKEGKTPAFISCDAHGNIISKERNNE